MHEIIRPVVYGYADRVVCLPFRLRPDTRNEVTVAPELDTLTQRRDWLTARIAAKESVGWDIEYDTRERDALTWALNQLAP